ncbi:hypothetical protein B0H19DRAFT_1057344 [Mycena capillaripes]|nr:hypothetical protein B0H19DRAFT_1057344 [Mycena capillaripes]
MPHQGPPCVPTTFTRGMSIEDHDLAANQHFFAVVIGKIPGIYLYVKEADTQTLKVHNQKMKKFDTHAEAVEYWKEWCLRLHKDHSAPRYKVKGVEGDFDSYYAALAAAASEYIVPV